jgi:hypothetical protein
MNCVLTSKELMSICIDSKWHFGSITWNHIWMLCAHWDECFPFIRIPSGVNSGWTAASLLWIFGSYTAFFFPPAGPKPCRLFLRLILKCYILSSSWVRENLLVREWGGERKQMSWVTFKYNLGTLNLHSTPEKWSCLPYFKCRFQFRKVSYLPTVSQDTNEDFGFSGSGIRPLLCWWMTSGNDVSNVILYTSTTALGCWGS